MQALKHVRLETVRRQPLCRSSEVRTNELEYSLHRPGLRRMLVGIVAC